VKNNKKVYVIACKVLRPDIQDAAKKAGLDVDFEFLPFGLHNTPAELTREVQKFPLRIDPCFTLLWLAEPGVME